MVARFRTSYGGSPLHLVALVASLLIAGAGVAGWLHNPATTAVRILVWFLGAIIAHDLILLPLYTVLDRVALRACGRPVPGATPVRTPGWVYVRVPALLSGLLFLVFFPEVLRLGDQTFRTASGLHQNVYLARFLLSCGTLFVLSGAAYVISLARARAGPRD